MPSLADIIAAAQSKLATLPATSKPLRFAPAPVATAPMPRPASPASAAQTFARPTLPRAYRAALSVPYSAPLAMLADAHPAGFTVRDMLRAGIAKPEPCALRDAPMPQPYAIPTHSKPYNPKRDGAGSLTSVKLIAIGLNHERETLLTIA